VTARAIVHAAGAWCTANLLRWGLNPTVVCLLNVGTHLVFRPSVTAAPPDRSAGTLLQNDDGRIVFFLPWLGRWLLGTTESVLAGDPGALRVPEADSAYLLRAATESLELERPEEHLAAAFAGVRTMPVARLRTGRAGEIPDSWREDPFSSPFYLRTYPRNLSAISREAVLDEGIPGLISVYGGKFTTYRALCERVADRLGARLGVRAPSATSRSESWPTAEIRADAPHLFDTDSSLWAEGDPAQAPGEPLRPTGSGVE
jgi:glycerol-3-phosphate dehydrogenase